MREIPDVTYPPPFRAPVVAHFCAGSGAWAVRLRERARAKERATFVPIEWSFTARANKLRAGDSRSAHSDTGTTWSGVYGGKAGDSVPGGSAPVQLTDPCRRRANALLVFPRPSTVPVEPKAGPMGLFPGYLRHTVLRSTRPGTVLRLRSNFETSRIHE